MPPACPPFRPCPADAVAYLRDALVTASAFVAAHPPAAAPLLAADGHSLLPTLATLHDRLLPQLDRVFATSAASWAAPGSGEAALRPLAGCCRRLAALLLRNGFCAAEATPGSGAGAGGSAAGPSSSAAAGAAVSGVAPGQRACWLPVSR
jgi:hypothetical protein